MISGTPAADRPFELAMDASPAGVVVVDAAGTIALVDRALEHEFGYQQGELVGKSIDVLLPGWLATAGAGSDASLAAPEPVLGCREVIGRRRDGSTIPVEVVLGTVRAGAAEFVLVSVVTTERKRRAALRAAAIEDLARFERLVADLSVQFINLPLDQIDQAIGEAFARASRWLPIDRGALFENAIEDGLTDVVRWDATEGVARASLARERYPWTIEQCLGGRVASFSALKEIPCEFERDAYRRAGVGSAFVVPLAVGGAIVGAAGFFRSREGQIWEPAVTDRIRVLASVLGQVVARRRRDDALRRAIEDVDRLRRELEHENVLLKVEARLFAGELPVIGKSDAVCRVFQQIQQVAATDATVLLLGETGTGKELFATEIHQRGPRRSRAMIRTNCAAIPSTLIESELFGREKGAFTGALSRQIGRFELASGSTIFLDEIGDLPPEVQVKLLRVLEEGQIERLGSPLPVKIDARIIAATHRNLEQRVAEGEFRDDLYYRLNVFPIRVPPLRERPEDIPLLTWRFVDEFSKKFGKRVEAIAPESLTALGRHSWPGNIRELRNVIERAMITTTGPYLVIPAPPPSKAAAAHSSRLEDVEREHIRSVLDGTGWRIRGTEGAAARLGLKPTTLETRLHKLGLRRPAARPA